MTDKTAKKKSPLISQYYRLVIWIQDHLVRFPRVEKWWVRHSGVNLH